MSGDRLGWGESTLKEEKSKIMKCFEGIIYR